MVFSTQQEIYESVTQFLAHFPLLFCAGKISNSIVSGSEQEAAEGRDLPLSSGPQTNKIMAKNS